MFPGRKRKHGTSWATRISGKTCTYTMISHETMYSTCNDKCIQSFPLISGYTRERWKGWITRETWSKGLFLRQDVIKFSLDKKNEWHEIGSAETEFVIPKSYFIDVWQPWKRSHTILMSSLCFSKPHFTAFTDQKEESAFYIHVYLINPICI